MNSYLGAEREVQGAEQRQQSPCWWWWGWSWGKSWGMTLGCTARSGRRCWSWAWWSRWQPSSLCSEKLDDKPVWWEEKGKTWEGSSVESKEEKWRSIKTIFINLLSKWDNRNDLHKHWQLEFLILKSLLFWRLSYFGFRISFEIPSLKK